MLLKYIFLRLLHSEKHEDTRSSATDGLTRTYVLRRETARLPGSGEVIPPPPHSLTPWKSSANPTRPFSFRAFLTQLCLPTGHVFWRISRESCKAGRIQRKNDVKMLTPGKLSEIPRADSKSVARKGLENSKKWGKNFWADPREGGKLRIGLEQVD